MNELNKVQVFNNDEFGEVRGVQIDGEPWMVGKDVATILGYERPTKAIQDHVDDEDKMIVDGKTQSQFGIELGQRGGWLINESGLYSLVLSSRLPSAKKFKRWVTSEVLPSIRKQGAYISDQFSGLSPILREMISLELEQKRQAQQLETVNKRVDDIRNVVATTPTNDTWRNQCRVLITKIAQARGGINAYRDVNNEISSLVDRRAGVSLNTRLTNHRNRMAEQGVCKSTRDKVSKVDIIAEDKKLIEIYTAIVKELAVKSGVA